MKIRLIFCCVLLLFGALDAFAASSGKLSRQSEALFNPKRQGPALKEMREPIQGETKSVPADARKSWIKKCGEWLKSKGKGTSLIVFMSCGNPTCSDGTCRSEAIYKYRELKLVSQKNFKAKPRK